MTLAGYFTFAPLTLLLAGTTLGQSSESELRIISPSKDDYLSGRVTIQAAVESQKMKVTRLRFFADGKLVCELAAEPFECNWDAGKEVAAHHIRVVAELSEGPRLVQNLITKERGSSSFSFRTEVNVVHVTAVVTRKGTFVKGLDRDSFEVYEERQPQEISSFASTNAPLEVVVAVDSSYSMTDGMPKVKQAVKSFLAMLAPEDRVTLLAFNDEIYTLARRETNLEARLSAVDQLEPWGRTSLYDAVIRSLDILGRTPGKRALVVFTDGEDVSSQTTLEEVEARVEASDATLFMIGEDRAIEDPDLRGVLERLSRRSGGRAFLDAKLDRLQRAFGEVYEEITSQYLLGYSSTDQDYDGGWRDIEIKLTRKGLKVRGREGYRAVARN